MLHSQTSGKLPATCLIVIGEACINVQCLLRQVFFVDDNVKLQKESCSEKPFALRVQQFQRKQRGRKEEEMAVLGRKVIDWTVKCNCLTDPHSLSPESCSLSGAPQKFATASPAVSSQTAIISRTEAYCYLSFVPVRWLWSEPYSWRSGKSTFHSPSVGSAELKHTVPRKPPLAWTTKVVISSWFTVHSQTRIQPPPHQNTKLKSHQSTPEMEIENSSQN